MVPLFEKNFKEKFLSNILFFSSIELKYYSGLVWPETMQELSKVEDFRENNGKLYFPKSNFYLEENFPDNNSEGHSDDPNSFLTLKVEPEFLFDAESYQIILFTFYEKNIVLIEYLDYHGDIYNEYLPENNVFISYQESYEVLCKIAEYEHNLEYQ